MQTIWHCICIFHIIIIRHRIQGLIINPLYWFALIVFNKLISQESIRIIEKETIKSREEFSSIKGLNERKNVLVFLAFWDLSSPRDVFSTHHFLEQSHIGQLDMRG